MKSTIEEGLAQPAGSTGKDNSGIDRRAFLRAGASAIAGGALLAQSGTPAHAQAAKPAASSIAQTRAGMIRGLYNGAAHVFKGVPYAAPTGGANRFMAPQSVTPWTGVRDATRLSHQSPQLQANVMPEEMISLDNSAFGEDCLSVNVWTAGLRDGAKRPVMVWFHGGGFSAGSGGDVRYDGTNLAHKHGVVLVTVNERLNAFGFLYLAELGGERYADSGNAGLLDLVASLKWVHDNIQEFGGDPGNVTIFGQSGGGGKVTALMATPAARGLFHRAIAESGLSIDAISTHDATDMARQVMDWAGLKPNQVDELQKLPIDSILAAMGGIEYGTQAGGFLRFGPVIDRRTLSGNPWDPVAPSVSAHVPLVLGSNLTEICFQPSTPKDPMTDRQLHEVVQRGLGFGARLNPTQADQLIALYRRGYPNETNVRLYHIMGSDNWMTANVAMVAERKQALRAAPAYVYHFEWLTPVDCGRLGSPHTLEIPFVFDNLDVPTVDIVTGSGEERYALADRMSRAWTTFARTGNPNVTGLPHWPAYTAGNRAVMVFNDDCQVEINPHAEQREAIAHLHAMARAARAAGRPGRAA
ncbi:MAG: carboxylesterase/lipase family protein [Steroidobacteraceae bacterium]